MFQESKYIRHLNYQVKTPFGWQRIEHVHKTYPLPTLKIIHDRGEIEVSAFHTFIVKQQEVQAESLRVGDILETQDGFVTITKIEDQGIKELYDITLDQSEFDNYWYYTNGVLSHNSGKSITVACYLTWLFNFNTDKNIGIVANRLAQATEFLRNVKDIFSRLPIWLQAGVTEWNVRSIANEVGMRILTDVPSSDSFRGYSLNCLSKKHVICLRDKYTGDVFEMTLGEAFYDWVDSEFPMFAPNERFEILTKTGFQPFDGIARKNSRGILIEFSDGSFIEATPDHLIEYNSSFIAASELEIGSTVNGKEVVGIRESDEIEFFDPVNVSNGNTYSSNGFEHHNCVVVDECAFIKESKWEEFADSIFPSQSGLAWKKNVIISTAKGLNHFYEIVQKAKLETSTPGSKSILVEVPWDEVPRYDSKGELIPPETFKSQIIKRFGRVYFEQNYGNSFVGSSETLVSPEVLGELQHRRPESTWDGMLRVYREPEEGHIYIMAVDAAKEGKDYFAIQVIDVTSMPFKQVAAANLQVDYLTMPDFIYEWAARFNTAHIIVENNEGAGQSIADMLVNHFEYPNMYYQDNKFKYPGFRTTSSTRAGIIRMLQILMNSAKLEVYDKETISEFQKFELVNNKYQASSGHDDLVMSLAIALAPFTSMNNFSDFGKFLEALKSDDSLEVGSFMDTAALAFEDF